MQAAAYYLPSSLISGKNLTSHMFTAVPSSVTECVHAEILIGTKCGELLVKSMHMMMLFFDEGCS